MELVVCASYQELSVRAADVVAHTIRTNPAAVLGLPTGHTPLGLYRELVRRVQAGLLDMSRVSVFALDDYLGLAPTDHRLFIGWLREAVIEPAGIDPARVHYLPSDTDDANGACAAYESAIARVGGIDLLALGIGVNGHLGFNEPGSPFDSRTRVVTLTFDTLHSNAAYWGGLEQVPQRAMTIGLGTILDARHLLLMATGASKQQAIATALTGPMTPDVPASCVQRAQCATVLVDTEAATALSPLSTLSQR